MLKKTKSVNGNIFNFSFFKLFPLKPLQYRLHVPPIWQLSKTKLSVQNHVHVHFCFWAWHLHKPKPKSSQLFCSLQAQQTKPLPEVYMLFCFCFITGSFSFLNVTSSGHNQRYFVIIFIKLYFFLTTFRLKLNWKQLNRLKLCLISPDIFVD